MNKILIFLLLFVVNLIPSYSQGDILWKFNTKDRIYSSPIIDGDIAYIGSGDHYFYAINKKTGYKVWDFKTGGAIHSSPFILNNLVYFASKDGNLYAVDKTDGSLNWKFESEGEKKYDLWDYYLSSPKGDEETIYWGCGDGNLYAIEGSNGQLKWKFKTKAIGAFAVPLAFLAMAYASFAPIDRGINPLIPALQSNWLYRPRLEAGSRNTTG